MERTGSIGSAQLPHGRAGFTLIELVIAITVLLVAVLASYVAQLSSHGLMQVSRETTTAIGDLQAAMEEVLTHQPDLLPAPTGIFPNNQPLADFNGLHLRNEQIVASYPGYAGAAVPDPLQIVLTLTFDDHKGRPRTLRLASMKAR